MVNRYQPDYCGFIIDFPKSHRSQTPDQVRALVKDLNRDLVTPVGVFVNEPVEIVAELLCDGTIAIAQLHGSEDEEYIRKLKGLTDKPIIKAFQVKNEETLALAAESSADLVLLDQGQGSGETFDWSILTQDVAKKAMERDWILAGGLSASNIAMAIEKFHPYAVDLSSAVETDQFKDEEKVKEIIALVRAAKA